MTTSSGVAPSTLSIEACDASLFFEPSLASTQLLLMQSAPPPLQQMQQQDVSALQQHASSDDLTNYNFAGGLGYLPPPLAYPDEPMPPDFSDLANTLADHTTTSLTDSDLTIGLSGAVLQRNPLQYHSFASDSSIPPVDPDTAFIAPSPTPYDPLGGIVAVQMCVQPGAPNERLPDVLQTRLQQSAGLGFTQQQQADISASAAVLWNSQQPFWTPPPEMMAAQQYDASAQQEVEDDFEMPVDDEDVVQQQTVAIFDPAAAAAAGSWVHGGAAAAPPGFDDQSLVVSSWASASYQNPDVARLLQTANCFQGAQKQFVMDLIGTIGTLLQHIRGGGGARAEKEKTSIYGAARFERASLDLHTVPTIFKFPSRDKKRSVYLDIAVKMANYSELQSNARTSITNFVKHIMNVIYLNPASSLRVTAGCTRSTVGLQVLRESSVRVLSNFWMAHFKSTHHQDEREVFDVITQTIKNYLDKKRSETGRQSGTKN